MKKQYTEPTTTIYACSITHSFLTGSAIEIVVDDATDEYWDDAGGNNDARDHRTFGSDRYIWDNEW